MIVNFLRVEWKLLELRDRLTILAMMGVRTEERCLRSQVGIGSESDCLLGQLCKILEISDSEAGLKVEKVGGGDAMELSDSKTEFRYFVSEEGGKAVSK